MAQGDRRRWERFTLSLELELQADEQRLSARLLDLGQGGMRVAISGSLVAAGAPLQAELSTSKGRLCVLGRVCWGGATADPCADDADAGPPQPELDEQQEPRHTCIGVAFEGLSDASQRMLAALEREHLGEPMLIQVPGANLPLRAYATQAQACTRLRVRIPFLSSGAAVKLRNMGRRQTQEGRILDAELYVDAVGCAHMELLVQPLAPVRRRRFVHYQNTRLERPERRPTAEGRDAAQPLIVPKTRLRAVWMVGIGATAVLWLGARLLLGADAAPLSPTPTGAEGARRPTTVLSAASMREVVQADPDDAGPGALGALDAAVSGRTSARPTMPAPTETSDTHALSASPPPASARSPRLTSTTEGSEIFIPARGSLEGLTLKQWLDPPAVVVELPHAEVTLSQPQYELQADGITGLSFGTPGGLTQVRVYVSNLLSQHEATAAPGGIMIRIKPDLRPPKY